METDVIVRGFSGDADFEVALTRDANDLLIFRLRFGSRLHVLTTLLHRTVSLPFVSQLSWSPGYHCFPLFLLLDLLAGPWSPSSLSILPLPASHLQLSFP